MNGIDIPCLVLSLFDTIHDFGQGAKSKESKAAKEDDNMKRLLMETRDQILEILSDEFKLITLDRRSLFQNYVHRLITEKLFQRQKQYDFMNAPNAIEEVATKLFYAHYFAMHRGDNRIYYDPNEFPLRNTTGGKERRNSEFDQLVKKSDPLFSSLEVSQNETRTKDYIVLRLDSPGLQSGIDLYRKMGEVFKAKHIMYFQDARPVKEEWVCISPEQINGKRSLYNGLAKQYDPAFGGGAGDEKKRFGSKFSKAEDVSASTSTSTVASSKKPTIQKCNISLNLSYSLSKGAGELIFFDRLDVNDSIMSVQVARLNIDLDTRKIIQDKKDAKTLKGLSLFLEAIKQIRAFISNQSIRMEQTTENRVAREKLKSELLAQLAASALMVLKDGYRITLDGDNDPRGALILKPRDYIRAIFDFKRAGDFGQVAACAAANKVLRPDETCAVFITKDRLASLFALYKNIPCVHVSTRDKGTFLKVCNFEQVTRESEEIEKEGNRQCPKPQMRRYIREKWNDIPDDFNANIPDSYKSTRGNCKNRFKNEMAIKIDDERDQLDELTYKLDIFEQVYQALQQQGGMQRSITTTPKMFRSTTSVRSETATKTMYINETESFWDFISLLTTNNMPLSPFLFFVLKFIFFHIDPNM